MVKGKKRVKKAFYAVLIGFAIIAFWRGLWGLMDEYLLPANYLLSLWISMSLGLIILIFTHHLVKEFV